MILPVEWWNQCYISYIYIFLLSIRILLKKLDDSLPSGHLYKIVITTLGNHRTKWAIAMLRVLHHVVAGQPRKNAPRRSGRYMRLDWVQWDHNSRCKIAITAGSNSGADHATSPKIPRNCQSESTKRYKKGQFWRKPRPHGKTLGLLWLSLDQDGLRPVDEDILESQAVGVGCVHVKPTLINSPPVYEKWNGTNFDKRL